MASRWLPVLGLALFFGVGFIWRAWRQWRLYGQSGIILFRSSSSWQRVRDAMFVLLLLLVGVQAIAAALDPAALAAICLVTPPEGEPWLALGAGLLFGGTAVMVAAQLHLGASWRIGIDEGASPGLVTGGLYRFCRNPIFSGMFLAVAGLAVLQPTWLSAVAVVGAVVAVRAQVLEEESYLLTTYGAAYRAYARRVGRFAPGFGRLN
jgi:protein-S-isoprenylcysteine O-methyltransferase Ste14